MTTSTFAGSCDEFQSPARSIAIDANGTSANCLRQMPTTSCLAANADDRFEPTSPVMPVITTRLMPDPLRSSQLHLLEPCFDVQQRPDQQPAIGLPLEMLIDQRLNQLAIHQLVNPG